MDFPRKAVKRVYPKRINRFKNTRATMGELQARIAYLTDYINFINGATKDYLIGLGDRIDAVSIRLDQVANIHNSNFAEVEKYLEEFTSYVDNKLEKHNT